MPLPKISEARVLTDEQLEQEIIAVKKQLFQLRLQQATRQLDKPHLFRHARHRLAQLMTVEGERKRASSSQPVKESK
ncbi:MAG: 50S ribosomal protein L29 [Brasilonema angustatum HA4187-MV1]|jgi:large subunit ribosomal protein L29|nr:50S ribosomal protein L29 [Brasilonema angustatum HA4187-MV1]